MWKKEKNTPFRSKTRLLLATHWQHHLAKLEGSESSAEIQLQVTGPTLFDPFEESPGVEGEEVVEALKKGGIFSKW